MAETVPLWIWLSAVTVLLLMGGVAIAYMWRSLRDLIAWAKDMERERLERPRRDIG